MKKFYNLGTKLALIYMMKLVCCYLILFLVVPMFVKVNLMGYILTREKYVYKLVRPIMT